ncbi:MAG: hypothetical protein H0W81_01895 [Chloroflexi bacterium]|nr:hypothetical protein [Chloroflexota bacterium]
MGEPTRDSIRADPASGAEAWTFGVPLCVTGSSLAILKMLRPARTVGTGFKFVGSGVRQFVATREDIPILSADGWPPAPEIDPDPMSNVSGFEVTQPCNYTVTGRYAELLIGLAQEGITGGGWEGIEISYSVNGRSFVLVLHHDIAICGTAVSCSPPGSSLPATSTK